MQITQGLGVQPEELCGSREGLNPKGHSGGSALEHPILSPGNLLLLMVHQSGAKISNLDCVLALLLVWPPQSSDVNCLHFLKSQYRWR